MSLTALLPLTTIGHNPWYLPLAAAWAISMGFDPTPFPTVTAATSVAYYDTNHSPLRPEAFGLPFEPDFSVAQVTAQSHPHLLQSVGLASFHNKVNRRIPAEWYQPTQVNLGALRLAGLSNLGPFPSCAYITSHPTGPALAPLLAHYNRYYVRNSCPGYSFKNISCRTPV